MSVGFLARHGCVLVEPDPTARRGKLVRLTPKGLKAQEKYHRLLGVTEKGWEARVEARTLDGRTIGAAEACCTRDESRWKTQPDYAIRSMAQTRATSKALRGPLGFIVTLAGFQATPAEEMGSDDAPASVPGLPYGPEYQKEMGKLTGAACES